MRKLLFALVPFAAALSFTLPAVPASAGLSGAHFVGTPQVTLSSGTQSVSAEEAGLGNVDQIHVVLNATVLCINGGGNHPKAVNKTTVTVSADEPVQNGHSDYTLSAPVVFSPDCSPPMTEQATGTLTDTTTGLTFSF
jgi:hypothetical protein